jgi:hypothetical protein
VEERKGGRGGGKMELGWSCRLRKKKKKVGARIR